MREHGSSRDAMRDPATLRFLDAHASTGRLPDGLGSTSLSDLASLGIHGGVASALASKMHDVRRGNVELERDLVAYPGWRACWTLLDEASARGTAAADQIESAIRAGAAAVTCYPRTQDYSIQQMEMAWGALASAQIPVIIDRCEAEWRDLDRLAAAHPQLSIIISSLGYRELRQLAPLLRRRSNVLLDTVNFSTHSGYDWFVNGFGADRLLFATGTPFRDAGEAITQLLWSGLSDDQVDLISYGNAERIFGLEATGPGPEPYRSNTEKSCEADTLRRAVLTRSPSSRRIVDAHAHSGPYSLFHIPDPDPEGMVRVMDRCGVNLAVISTNRAIQEDSRLGNDETVAAVDAFPDRIRGYGVVNPWQDPETELERIAADHRFVGIKIHPDLHRYPLTGSRYRAVWEFSAQTGCPVLTHTWYQSPFDTPGMLLEVARQHRDINVLIGHSGTLPPGFEESLDVAERVPGAHLEICGSFMTQAALRMMLGRLGAHRILFGSDFPFIDQRVSLGRVAFSDLMPDELDAVLAANADRLFGWRHHSTPAVEGDNHHERTHSPGVAPRVDRRSFRS